MSSSDQKRTSGVVRTDAERASTTLLGMAMSAAGPVSSFALISLLSNLVILVGPIFMLQVYDRVLPSRSMPTLWALVIIVVVLYAAYALIEAVRARMTIRFSALVDGMLSPLAFKAAVRSRLVAFSQLQADPVRDLETVRQFVGGPGPVALFDLPWMPIYIAAVFLLHPLLGWVTIGGVALMAVLLIVNEVLSKEPARDVVSASARRQTQADDAKANAESIAAMGLMPAMVARWERESAMLDAAQQRAADRVGLYAALSKALRFLIQSGVLAAGAYLVIVNEATGGLMIAASIISSRAIAPIEQIIGQWRSFVAARQSWQRLQATLEATQKPAPGVALPAPKLSLRVEQLATGVGQLVLVQGVSFGLVAGEAMGILGPSGSGKSSVARALVGVWPALRGEIRLDGSALAHFDPDRLGRHVGYLAQQVELFAGTIAENISRFGSEPDPEALFAAARAAQVHDLIASLPNGYDTQIGERGTILSAGQRQRIGLARALYGDPFLIVLDEPNSNLDAEGDAALTEAIRAAKSRGAVVVVVAHRPSAVAAADKILFLKGGRQVTFGPKDEVLSRIAQPGTTPLRPRAALPATNA